MNELSLLCICSSLLLKFTQAFYLNRYRNLKFVLFCFTR